MADGLRVGLADHLGWAVAVTAGADHSVVDRRRIHYDRGRLDLAAALPAPVVSVSLGSWPADFPDDLAATVLAGAAG
jgi:hypothetical protein